MAATEQLSRKVGTVAACDALGVARSSVYERRRRQKHGTGAKKRPTPQRALSPQQRQKVLDILHEKRFVDKSPGEVYATLLDEYNYFCSERTMYRILASKGEVKERRNQRRHPNYAKPELLASNPNEVWSWDITKFKGPVKWSYFYLYVILDIYSRYVVGWMVADRECSGLAKRLIQESCEKQGIEPEQLTLHSDRGSSMTSKTTGQLLGELGITKSLSRPHVSDDNPFSEAHFKTLKYRPEFPGRFGSIEDAISFCRKFFLWYNTEHRHSGIAMMTPEVVHYRRSAMILKRRGEVLEVAFKAYPERFVLGKPVPSLLPDAVWINPPAQKETIG